MNPALVEAAADRAVVCELPSDRKWLVGGATGAPSACPCGVRTSRRLCHFCRKTLRLIRLGLCVSCQQPVVRQSQRHEGKCVECRNEPLCYSTRRLLRQAARARAA